MKLFLIFIISIYSSCIFGQDTLYFRNGETELITAIDFDKLQIKYTLFNSENKTVFYKSNQHVQKVNLANGNSYVFQDPAENKPVEVRDPYRPTYLNSLSFELFDILYQQITVYYTRSFPQAKGLTLGIPLSASGRSLTGNLDGSYGSAGYYDRNKIFSTGFDLMSPLEHFMYGGSCEIGFCRQNLYYDIYSPEGNFLYTASEPRNNNFFGLFFRTGYAFNPLPHFFLSVFGDVGVVNRQYYYINLYGWSPVQYSIYQQNYTNLGFRLKIKLGITF
jgi:hypothetical protein